MKPIPVRTSLLLALALSVAAVSCARPTAPASEQGTPPELPSVALDPGLPQVPLNRGDAERGEATFRRVGCLTCHSVRGAGGTVAPDLTDIGRRAASRATAAGLSRPESYLIQSITDPHAYVVEGYVPLMGDWQQQFGLSEQDLADVVVFLMRQTAE